MIPKLSAPSKMPCKSWSLQAIDTCPASKAKSGGLVDACKGCYATDGNYLFPNVKNVREHNKEAWQQADFVDHMVSMLAKETHFRWFDSGDVYSFKLAIKIFQVMLLTPHVKHWLPTRMHKFDKFKPILQKMASLDNVVVRKSSDSIHGDYDKRHATASTIVTHDTGLPGTCEAYSRGGKCIDCRLCWDKSVPVIRYPQHGRKMAKVNRDIIAIAA